MADLQIYVYGSNGYNDFLDLEAGTVLDLEGLHPAFDEELNIGEFTLPLEVIMTERNAKIFGFPLQPENFARQNNYWICDVYDRGFPEMQKAKVTILQKQGSFTKGKGRISISISGNKGIYGALIKNKKLTDLQLNGKITWDGMDSREFAFELMSGNQYFPQIVFVPVAIENFFDTERTDFTDEFLAKDTVNNVIINGPSSWIFGRPDSAFPDTPVAEGDAEYIDYRTVPFYKAKFVLQKCFEEFGYSVTGNFINDTDFDDLLIYNHFAIEKYDAVAYEDLNREISPPNHMPDILIKDFLVNFLGVLGLYPVFGGDNIVTLVYRKNDLQNKKIANLDPVVQDEFESSFEDGEGNSGYKLNYEWESNDNYQGDRVKDLTNKTRVATVNTADELPDLDIGRPLTTDDIALVLADNMFWVVIDGTGLTSEWEPYAENLDEFVKDDGENGYSWKISTLCTYVVYEESLTKFVIQTKVGTRNKGSYVNLKNAQVQHPFGLRIFYGKMQEIDDITFPTSFNHNRNALNEKIVPYSLSFNGDDGLARNFHELWRDTLRNKEEVKINILADKKVLTAIETNNRFEIQGVQYFHKKTERTIPLGREMKLFLVPL